MRIVDARAVFGSEHADQAEELAEKMAQLLALYQDMLVERGVEVLDEANV